MKSEPITDPLAFYAERWAEMTPEEIRDVMTGAVEYGPRELATVAEQELRTRGLDPYSLNPSGG